MPAEGDVLDLLAVVLKPLLDLRFCKAGAGGISCDRLWEVRVTVAPVADRGAADVGQLCDVAGAEGEGGGRAHAASFV
ncbi:hypothetical protein ACFFX0_25760 [Citricoccus parietis]|uniref:Uncharacterized protein n=1 Tax=Citricoccus parietis TaxID=592307 RepID=A0ABV5G634_9MICC